MRQDFDNGECGAWIGAALLPDCCFGQFLQPELALAVTKAAQDQVTSA